MEQTPFARSVEQTGFKIEWARLLLQHLENVIGKELQPTEQLIRSEFDEVNSTYVLRVGPQDGIPIEIPLLVGDIIHNLNSVFDYLWTGLTQEVNASLQNRVHFPRHETLHNLRDALSKSPILSAFPQIEAVILDQIMPYKCGNYDVWAVGKLDNISKHRTLLITPSLIKIGKFIARGDDDAVINLSYGKIQTPGTTINLGFRCPFVVEYDDETEVDYVFSEDLYYQGKSLSETISKLIEVVSDARSKMVAAVNA